MAQYTITHSCGHEQTHQLFGKSIERESKQEWLESTPCTDCWKEEQQSRKQKEIEETRKRTEKYLSTHSLPELKGSEKQIKWANDLRVAIIDEFHKIKKAILVQNQDKDPLIPILLSRFEADILSNTSAKWWIDNRYQSHNDIMSGGNPIQMLSYALDGKTPKTSAQSLLLKWLDKQPEIIGRREAVAAEEKRQLEEKIKREKELVDQIEKNVNDIDWTTLNLREGFLLCNGHKIRIDLVNLAYYKTYNLLSDLKIDSNSIQSQYRRIRDIVQRLDKKINEQAGIQLRQLLSKNIFLISKPEHTDESELNPAFKIKTSIGWAEGWMGKKLTKCHLSTLDGMEMVYDLMDEETKQLFYNLKHAIKEVISAHWDEPVSNFRKPGTKANPETK
ncbi:MAG: hypothetical protein Kow0098_03450 [Ignavibacteriaceae bacterium]